MNVMEAISHRRSIRSYTDEAVSPEHLRQVLEAGRLAPSGSNRQEWVFVVVRDAARRKQLAEACHRQQFIAQAPVVIVACATDAKRTMSSGLQGAAVDTTIAVDHMTLTATELGLGTCWIGAFDAAAVAKVIGLPAGVAVTHVLPLGHPAESPTARPRKALEDIVRYDTY
ncbi:MAG TPA: nitroreductase family protein [Phycisphaerae bacterium]|nr:nitroreductase family protein [Phycisphaerae bacterium]